MNTIQANDPRWIRFAERTPPHDQAVNGLDPTAMISRQVLVTNNLNAKDSTGNMSHIWYARAYPDSQADGYVAFDEADRRIIGLTHWLDPFAPFPTQPTHGDPWERQAELMHISDQEMHEHLMMGVGSILYLALKFEELGETVAAMIAATLDVQQYDAGTEYQPIVDLRNFFRDVGVELQESAIGETLKEVSKMLRAMTKAVPDGAKQISFPLRLAIAREIVDGTTDEAVVNAGFALSLGIPGAQAYAAVNDSNLSKANPVTGWIDKDASGKWIPGPNYRKPDLDGILLPLIHPDVVYYRSEKEAD